MRLLFDQNLSPTLVQDLADRYPGSTHVQQIGLDRASDSAIRAFAKNQDYVIVTKDADFHEYRILSGEPPNVLWIRQGNCSTKQVEALHRQHHKKIEQLSLSEAGFIIIR